MRAQRRTFGETEAQVLACLDEDDNRLPVTSHARVMANALGLKLAFAQILEIPAHGAFPADPVDWNVRFAECRENLERLRGRSQVGQASTSTPVVLAGTAHERLNDWAEEHRGSVLVLSRHGGTSHRGGLGRTTDAILQRGAASVLLFPPPDGEDRSPCYRRLLVPLDGSANSESVLPLVARLAKIRGSQVILVHIAQSPDDDSPKPSNAPFIVGGLEGSNIAPRAGAVDRDYLETWKTRLVRQDINADLCLGSGSKPGEELANIASRRDVDLIVVSSHGQTNRTSAAYGSVTAFLAQTATCPLFIVRPELQISTIAKERSGRISQASAQDAEFAS